MIEDKRFTLKQWREEREKVTKKDNRINLKDYAKKRSIYTKLINYYLTRGD